jgi:tetratricopeptide (TPR) repeat protein
MGADWFQKQSWSQADQEDFWQRLARAREHNRGQYIFIQGYTLMEVGPQYTTNAIALFDLVIDRYSDTISFVQALSAKATCLLSVGDNEGALTYYRRAIEQRRVKPSVETWAWLDFAWVVATKGISDRCEVALDVLDEFGNSKQLFPVLTFRLNGSRALILSACGLIDSAADAARAALAAADREASGLRHHQKIGIVGSRYEDVRTRLMTIAAATSSKS